MKSIHDVRGTVPRELVEIVAAATLVFMMSVWEHLPMIAPNHYSDIASVYWRDGIGTGEHLIPYYQYTFEYPVLIGALVYLTSSVSLVVPDFSVALNYYVLATDAVLYPFAIGTVIAVYKIAVLLGRDRSRIWKAFLIVPSFVMFVVYNWDIIAIFFATLSIYYYLKREKTKSALSLGLGISAKLYPAVLVPVYLAEERDWRSRIRMLLLSIAPFAALNLPFVLANFAGWLETWRYLAEWGIENSWLIFVFNQMDPTAHYAALLVVLYLVYKGLAGTARKSYEDTSARLVERAFLVNIAWLVGNYIVTPQMALMLLPFYALIPSVSLLVIYLAEVMNALVIVLWFTPGLSFGNPLSPASPVQWLALGRQLVWLGLFIHILYPEKGRRIARLFRMLVEPVST
jgi:uncharacterized membrane protein